jgi:hypothetical protein
MRQLAAAVILAASFSLAFSAPTLADTPVHFGEIWLNGALVRTLLPPSPLAMEGTAPFYMVPGTGGVAGAGPGDADYRGGAWKVYVVTWNTAVRPLTSQTAILAAQAAGDITITRNAAADFRCPIQP